MPPWREKPEWWERWVQFLINYAESKQYKAVILTPQRIKYFLIKLNILDGGRVCAMDLRHINGLVTQVKTTMLNKPEWLVWNGKRLVVSQPGRRSIVVRVEPWNHSHC